MGVEVNHLGTHPGIKRDYDARAASKTPQNVALAKEFGFDFFDGDREVGYGGYRYDGRWVAVAERLRDYYELAPDAAILDVGCGKGFLLHDLKELMPACTVAGVDVSEYAIEHAMEDVKPFLRVASGDALPYPDDSFDLVMSINSIHNLPLDRCKVGLREMERVSRAHKYVTLDAWYTEEEHENLLKWMLTAESYLHADDWRKVFDEVGYTGDYHWFIAD
jgi:SAM-dependent methyltransferase